MVLLCKPSPCPRNTSATVSVPTRQPWRISSWARLRVDLEVHRSGEQVRMTLAGSALPRGSGGQIRLAVDVTPWPHADAECSPNRLHCHWPCRCDGVRQTIPGWPYSVIVALESGRSSWTAPLDAQRIGLADDLTEVTAAQIRDLHARLCAAGQSMPVTRRC